MSKSVKQTNHKEEPKTTWRTLHYFWQEVKKYKWWSISVIVVTILVVFVNAILGPLVFSDLIGKVSSTSDLASIIPGLLTEALVYLGLYAFSNFVLDQLRLYLCWESELKAMYDLSNQCFDVISAQSMQFHSDRFSGSLVSQTNKFVGAYERLLDTIIWNVVPLISRVVMTLVVLWPLSPWFAIGIVILTVIYTIIAGVTYKGIGHLNDEEAEAQNKQTGQLADSISNIISVKSYARETYEEDRFKTFSRGAMKSSNKLMHATIGRNFVFSVVEISLMGLLLAFLVYGPEWLGISVSTMVLIVSYANGILGELWGITSIFKNMNRVFGDTHEMTLILDTVDDVVDAPNAQPLVIQETGVDFQNISFQHADAKTPIFEDFNLKIQPGERVGLVGVSGSGKTTLTKLLLRFADVSRGEVTISGQNIKDITQQSLRENIAYVPQETSLFHRSIADNIAYGKPDATPEEIKRAAELANADEFIMELPDGYETLVGERGIKLSGGQRQRIAIARAILKDAPILVLDEATSALDSESEALIQDALTRLMAGRTSIVIAHRLSTVASLDRIVVLENGKIVEQGKHHDLLKKADGVYHHLWSRQSGAFME